MAIIVSLKEFEGPLDLLLHLIQQAKVDIREIFVSQITEQYLASMSGIDEVDMDRASEFLAMAALLLEIKSRAMLPKPPPPEDPDAQSPEELLIRRLEEYKLFKEGAGQMKEFEKAALSAFSKLPEEIVLPEPEVELTGLTLKALQRALERIIARKLREAEPPGRVFESILRDNYTIDLCEQVLTARLRLGPVRFSEVLSSHITREEVVTFFSAMLEMIRKGETHVLQDHLFDDILMIPGRRREEETHADAGTA